MGGISDIGFFFLLFESYHRVVLFAVYASGSRGFILRLGPGRMLMSFPIIWTCSVRGFHLCGRRGCSLSMDVDGGD